MFGRSFKPAKCKTVLRLAISRIKLLKNKRDVQLKQTRRELAQLLQSGQESTARIRVEQVIREQNIIAAYEFIELFCELIVARLPIIESQKNCPIDLQEAISSLIFAAPRCADIPELSEIRSHFGSKYGKEFVTSATELRPECGVNRTVIEKLSARTPSGEEKMKMMKEIAKEHEIEWDPAGAEKDLCKPHEDLLDGPSKFVGATKIPIEPAKESYKSVSGKKHELDSQVSTGKMPNSSGTPHSVEAAHYTVPSMSNITKNSATSGMPSFKDSQYEERNNTHSSVSSANISEVQSSTGENSTNPVELHKEPLERSFRSLSSGKAPASSTISNEIGLPKSNEWNMKFKDVASAAQAAAYSAEKASEAAKAAAELSKINKVQKQDFRKVGADSFSPSSSDDDTMGLNSSWMTRKPNDFVQVKNQSSGNDLPARHYAVNHSENAKSHQSERWKSGQQKEIGDIGNEYELPEKSTNQVDSYQWPSDKIIDDNMPRTREPVYDRREERHYSDSKEDKPYAKQDSSTIEYVKGSQFWRRETSISHSSTQTSEDFNNSFSIKSESAEELEMKRPEDSRNTVTQLPLFDDSPHSVRSNIKLSPQMNEKTFIEASSSSDEAPNQFYESNTTSQPPIWPPPDLCEPSQSQSKYLLPNRNRYPGKVSAQTRNAPYDSSSSEDDGNNSMLRAKPSSSNFMQSGKWSFKDHDGSAWDSTEAHAKNGKSQRNVYHQNEITDSSNEYDMSPRRNSRTDLYRQPSNRVYWEGNRTLSEKSKPFKKDQDQVDNHESAVRQETNMHNSVAEPLSRRKVRNSHSTNQASDIFGNSDGMTSESEEEIELEKYKDNSRKASRLPPFSKVSHSASSSSKPDNLKHTEDVSTTTKNSVTATHSAISMPNSQYQPPKHSPSGLSDSSQTGSQSLPSAGGSKVAKEHASKRASHVHPKLPDYDDLTALFASMKRQ